MLILKTPNWSDYELVDSGDSARLERFGKYILVRPDPQAIWKPTLPASEWNKANAVFERTSGEKGKWIFKHKLPEKWLMHYRDLSFYVKLSPFKHTGVFPEQAAQWDWIRDLTHQRGVTTKRAPVASPATNILNLFAYTGIASLAAASTGAKVTHVDASRPTISWARENQEVSGLQNKPIRFILDDAIKFVQREARRGVKYDGIIMDPPVFGHGPEGKVWKFNESFPQLLEACKQVLSDNPLFILVNTYAISSSALMLENVLKDYFKNLGGNIECGELALEEKYGKRLLSTGIFARWSK